MVSRCHHRIWSGLARSLTNIPRSTLKSLKSWVTVPSLSLRRRGHGDDSVLQSEGLHDLTFCARKLR